MSSPHQTAPARAVVTPLSGAEAAYRAATRALAGLALLVALTPLMLLGLALGGITAGWAGFVIAGLVAAAFARPVAARLSRPFEDVFETATGQSYTAVQTGADTGADEP